MTKAKKKNVKKSILLYVLSFGVFLLVVFCLKEISFMKTEKMLSYAVYKAVDTKTNGVWDKKVDIDQFDATKKAAKGSWWAHDRWQWIAWQNDDKTWTVLVSMDGFPCPDLDTIPSTYQDFFQDVIFQFGKRYCY